MLVSVDPGAQAAGVACFHRGALRVAFLARGDSWEETTQDVISVLTERLIQPTMLVMEEMQIYSQNKQKGRQKDLLTLTKMSGALIALVGFGVPHKSVTPSVWKGQVPKNIMIERVKNCLTDKEKTRVELPKAKGLQHNVWDAIGIGLHLKGKKI